MARRGNKHKKPATSTLIVRVNAGDPALLHMFAVNLLDLQNFFKFSMSAPIIKPIKLDEYASKQSKYQHAATPPTRSLILAPSGSGKTVLLQNMILDIYRDCFSREYIFSLSIDVDMTWNPVKEYLARNLKQDEKKEKHLFDSYQPAELERIIETQHKVTQFMKDNKMKNIYQVLIFIDDFADDPSFTRNSKLLHSL